MNTSIFLYNSHDLDDYFIKLITNIDLLKKLSQINRKYNKLTREKLNEFYEFFNIRKDQNITATYFDTIYTHRLNIANYLFEKYDILHNCDMQYALLVLSKRTNIFDIIKFIIDRYTINFHTLLITINNCIDNDHDLAKYLYQNSCQEICDLENLQNTEYIDKIFVMKLMIKKIRLRINI